LPAVHLRVAALFYLSINILNVNSMKRIGFLFAALMVMVPGLGVGAVQAKAPTAVVVREELPWAVVDAVLKEMAEEYEEYPYSQLVEWYSDSLLTVEDVGGGSYRVTVYEGGNVVISVIIETL
jgi:hypothetical protein